MVQGSQKLSIKKSSKNRTSALKCTKISLQTKIQDSCVNKETKASSISNNVLNY